MPNSDSEKKSKCIWRINVKTELQHLLTLEENFYIIFDYKPEPIRIGDRLEYTIYLHKDYFDNFINFIERSNDELKCPQIDFSIDDH